MRAVKGGNTTPEIAVRKAIHSLGLRFRLHRRDLPGSPDIVLSRLKTIVFVHGCFWHRHNGCKKASTPATRGAFWADKFAANIARDKRVVKELRQLGWKVIVVWECETKSPVTLKRRLLPLITKAAS